MTAVVNEYPDNISARTALVAIAVSDGDWDGAHERIDAAVSVYEKHSPLFNLRGIVAEHDGNDAVAEQHYLRSLELNPNAINSHINLANLYSRQGRHTDALFHWKTVAEFGHVPEHVIRYAHTLVLVEDPDGAIDALGLAFDDFDTEVNVSTIAGMAYVQKGEYIKALRYLRKAKALGNVDPNIDRIINAIEAQIKDQ
jgi:tetratricopeptide (TPR) repeat protein